MDGSVAQDPVETVEGVGGGMSADIVDSGIVLTGGGALLKNLDTRLKLETGMPIIVADDPLSSVVLGSGQALDNIDILREIAID